MKTTCLNWIFIVLFVASTGCSTFTTSVDYKLLTRTKKVERASYLNSVKLVIYPPSDVRRLKNLPRRPLTIDEKKRFIGGYLGRYAFLLARPVVDIVYDAMISEFEVAGYTVVRGTGSETPSNAGRYFLLTQLKLADGSYYGCDMDTASANIILDYSLKTANGELLLHDVLDKLVTKTSLLNGPNTPAKLLIHQCLPRVMESLVKNIDQAIQRNITW